MVKNLTLIPQRDMRRWCSSDDLIIQLLNGIWISLCHNKQCLVLKKHTTSLKANIWNSPIMSSHYEPTLITAHKTIVAACCLWDCSTISFKTTIMTNINKQHLHNIMYIVPDLCHWCFTTQHNKRALFFQSTWISNFLCFWHQQMVAEVKDRWLTSHRTYLSSSEKPNRKQMHMRRHRGQQQLFYGRKQQVFWEMWS